MLKYYHKSLLQREFQFGYTSKYQLTNEGASYMTYITCDHPSDQIEIKREIIKTTDVLVKYEKPVAHCNKCKCDLPEQEKSTIKILNFWFITQDGRTTAQLQAA